MEPLHPIGRFFSQIVSAAKALSGKLAREKPVDPPPAVIGLSPPVRGLKPIPEDIDEHLVDFCTRYWEPLEEIAKKRMREVGVPEERIGMLDVDNDYRLAVFHPKQLDGGGVHPPTPCIHRRGASIWTRGFSSRACLPKLCPRTYHRYMTRAERQ